jgi:hypothetical protein
MKPLPREWYKSLARLARSTGYTASLVIRDGRVTITIDPRPGDTLITRAKGKNGMFVSPNDNPPAEWVRAY